MEKLIKRMMNKRSAKLTVELSIMIAILVVAVIAVLVMFGSGLRDVAQNNGIKNMLTAEKTEYNPFDRKYENIDIAKTQENIGAAGEQGEITAKFDAEHPEEWINEVFAQIADKTRADLSNDDMDKILKWLAMVNQISSIPDETLEKYEKKAEDLKIKHNNSLTVKTISYETKDGKIKTLDYTKQNNDNMNTTPEDRCKEIYNLELSIQQ